MDEKHCKELLGQLSAYIDGELEAELCAQIEQHMAGCENCRIMVDTLRRTIILYKTQPRADVPARVHQELVKVLELDRIARTESDM